MTGVGVGGMGGANGQTGLAMNGGRLGRYVSSESEQSESDSQGTTQHADDWMFNNNAGSHGEHRLSVIPEHTEGVESVPMTTMAASPGGGSSPTSMLPRGALMVGRNGLYNGNNLRSRPQDLDFEVRAKLLWCHHYVVIAFIITHLDAATFILHEARQNKLPHALSHPAQERSGCQRELGWD